MKFDFYFISEVDVDVRLEDSLCYKQLNNASLAASINDMGDHPGHSDGRIHLDLSRLQSFSMRRRRSGIFCNDAFPPTPTIWHDSDELMTMMLLEEMLGKSEIPRCIKLLKRAEGVVPPYYLMVLRGHY